MKVILLQDVAKIGKKGQIVEVPDGYAMNKLIPRKMAEAATLINQRRIENLGVLTSASNQALATKFAKIVEEIKGKTIKVEVQTSEQGHTFRAISEADIMSAAKSAGIEIGSGVIQIESPIKSVGTHTVLIVSGQNKADLSIEVVTK